VTKSVSGSPERYREKLARWWAARFTLAPGVHWLLVWGVPITLLLGAVFAIGAAAQGSALTAWDQLTGVTGPGSADPPWAGYMVSVVGYLAAPAFIGGTVGLLVELKTASYRRPLRRLSR
jgi:hypothetical protein